MAIKGFTIAQVAKYLDISEKTVRRRILSGKLKAELVPGIRGDEYRIFNLEDTETREKTIPKQDSQTVDWDIIRELSDKISMLSGQLGASLEREKSLESQLMLLQEGKKPWYKRIFS